MKIKAEIESGSLKEANQPWEGLFKEKFLLYFSYLPVQKIHYNIIFDRRPQVSASIFPGIRSSFFSIVSLHPLLKAGNYFSLLLCGRKFSSIVICLELHSIIALFKPM